MKYHLKCCLLILAATIVALAIRLPQLARRPMHCDEAVHACIFRDLLERGDYRYSPNEYHGPTLGYLTLIPTWLGGSEKLTQINECTLRGVSVFFGVLLVLLTVLLFRGLTPPVAIIAALLTAVCPAMVYYSRYYLHEMLLVCFTFGAIISGYRYTQNRNIIWALLTGLCLGLMHATKETCIIAFGAMAISLTLVLIMRRWQNNDTLTNTFKTIKPAHWAAAIAVACLVSVSFYSSFFTNLHGIPDSFRSFIIAFNRASRNPSHPHPWNYFLKIMIYSQSDAGPAWSDAVIILLAAIGFIVAMVRKGIVGVNFHLLRFIAFYTAIMTISYSAIPYKTPWCMLGFLHGMILLAAVGAVTAIKLTTNLPSKILLGLLLLAAGVNFGWMAYLASYRYAADTVNPYAYVHTSPDVYEMVQRIEKIAAVHPRGHDMIIHIVSSEHNYWPLPWYLRSFNNVGYYDKVSDNITDAEVIIASPDRQMDLREKLYNIPPTGQINLYVPIFDRYLELRPSIELRGYATKDLWDRFQEHQGQSPPPATQTDR